MGQPPFFQRLKLSEQLLQTLALMLALIFLSAFFISEREGLVKLWNFVTHAIQTTPDFINKIIDYFEAVPSNQLRPSLLIGAIFGAISTAVVYLSAQGGANLANFSPRNTGLAILIGTGVGAASSQILMYPMQHCTYAPEIESAQYRLGLLVTVFSTLIALVPTWTLLLRRKTTDLGESSAGYFKSYFLPYLLLLPTLIFLGLFLYYPAIQIMTLSLRRKIAPLPQERFACLQNYVNLQDDQIYRNSFTTSLIITLFVVLLSIGFSLAVAVLASQKVKGAGIYRTLLIWSYAISPVVTGVIFLSMFREGGTGLINWALGETLGISSDWLTDPNLARVVIIGASVWNILGFNILFYIAGLQNIPGDLLEAAALDGANRVQRFWRITFPLLSPFTFFLLVTNITFSFYGIYGAVDTLTQGGPPLGPAGSEGGATNVLIYKLYQDAFGSAAPAGLAAAQAVILFLMVAVFTILQFRFVERRVTYGG